MADEVILCVFIKLMERILILRLMLLDIVRNMSARNLEKPSGFFTYHQVKH